MQVNSEKNNRALALVCQNGLRCSTMLPPPCPSPRVRGAKRCRGRRNAIGMEREVLEIGNTE